MRKYYLDNVRWSTVLLVVVYHCIYMFNGIATDGIAGPLRAVQYQDSLQYVLYPWFMVLLFIVSGMCSKYYLDSHTEREYLRSRTLKLLVPSTVGLFAFQWIQGIVNMRLGGAFEQMAEVPKLALFFIAAASGIGVLWFIQMLWLFSMLLLLLRKIEKGRLYELCGKISGSPVTYIVSGIAVWAAAQVLNMPVIVVYRFGIYGLSFLLGYYIFSHEKSEECLVRYRFAALAAAVISGVFYVKFYYGQNYSVSPAVNCPLAVTYLWFVCLAILGLAKRYWNKSDKFTQLMASKSRGIYFFHYLPVSVCGILFAGNTSLPPVLIYIITFVSAIAGALILNEIISRVPVLRWCVLGIKKERKNV